MIRWMTLLWGLLLADPVVADVQVNVVGLYSGKALLVINGGRPQMLTVGQNSPEGVKLLAADSKRAVLEVEGHRKELAMGQAVSVTGTGASPNQQSATLYADHAGHFFTEGQINGKTLKFLLDTGATGVVMNSGDARYAGIDYKRGEVIPVQTAAGLVKAYRVTLNSLKLGGIVLNQVEGMVLEGGSPPHVLLGMSALQRLEMKRDGIALTLTKKY